MRPIALIAVLAVSFAITRAALKPLDDSTDEGADGEEVFVLGNGVSVCGGLHNGKGH